MRLVVQRVKKALVEVDGKVIGKIEKGFFILLGVGEGDTQVLAENLAEKIGRLRVMADKKGKMNLSIRDIDESILVVSQFTLYADTSQGNRPSFIHAADPKIAEELYNFFIFKLKEIGVRVESGEFGGYMKIKVELDGPVTIILDTDKAF
ncbi:D-tyrosyl-tRNA(Tyr) deacylase [Candidatus Woesebacteria bacterium RIFCSPHIGHO2_01_FULL_38_10]|uniref:D-aminoacyl-tRNA deacylase n=1 Tax=Candidatus Woesebacteria bacterium RIFCSPLOWO2_01_FULL_39_10b TaxID=1802517 RepID=A0A1F8B9S8_9BACT|nr:MAG: D-tyrosyl-tRNA(Tyr) deacylase [Candidatus Woesebacteria bacterium RIFCSPHIGHO2_01_FULL_38_10]OGM60806.1 MAG: D-tyrosyl-tRNA(Tyr) deacylase [Candidatus Woesebacteria bacterium RIFCSPLOWO2_01_FULL_39_10b]